MLEKNWKIFSLAVLAVIFFFAYLYLYLPTAPKYPDYLILNQPDESVNYFFIRELALNNRFGLPEPLSGFAASQVHPRSATVVNGLIVPIGFPGMIVIFSLLARLLAEVFGVENFNLFAVALTPLLAAIAPFFFYGFLRRIFDDRLAWFSAVLLFFMPAWWYYASRPFQHNTLFVFLAMAGAYCYCLSLSEVSLGGRFERKRGILSSGRGLFIRFLSRLHRGRHDKQAAAFLAGLFFGLAIYVRPPEIVWLAVLGLFGLAAARKRWDWHKYFACGAGLALAAIFFFATQTVFYGHPLASGYVRPTVDGTAGAITAGPQGMSLAQAVFLPFGFHPRAIFRNFRAYFVDLFGIWTFLAIAGIVVWMARGHGGGTKRPKPSCFYRWDCFGPTVLSLAMTIYLLVFYGSWTFYDNLLKVPAIGASYVRYFLPVYVFGLPFSASFLIWLWPKRAIFKITAVILFLTLIVNSLGAVFAPMEGLAAIKTTVRKYAEWQSKVYSLTEQNAVIVTRYADKYLFPGRKIIPGWELTERQNAIVRLARENLPVYLYDLKLTGQEEKTWQEFLSIENLKLSAPSVVWEDLELRKIEK